MREILFRGKTKSGDWVYDGMTPSLRGTEFFIGNMFECDEVIAETVGEYTGLNDDNGTKIFEGDIIRIVDKSNEFEFITIVEFGNPNGLSSWGWQLKIISGAKNVDPDILLWVETEMEEITSCEVIGNVLDNRELIQGVEE